MLDFFRHHLHLSLLVFREEVQRIEVAISSLVVLGLLFLHFHIFEFNNSRKRNDSNPVCCSYLVKTSIEERRRFSGLRKQCRESGSICEGLVPQFSKRPSDCGKHCKTRMLDFGFSHVHELGLVFSGESKWVETNITSHSSVKKLGPRSEWKGLRHASIFSILLGRLTPKRKLDGLRPLRDVVVGGEGGCRSENEGGTSEFHFY
mmetsp:Transcript_2692/g.6282  ORF Transcript_2692/g.6282 Transcript_2692/m.6282 type:complete len:204 (+) Transcript_2692:145-756(+)